jgi:hypothetical protein
MRIISYEYQDVAEANWHFLPVTFGKMNLLVGGTSSGKSRLLDTIFDLGRFVAANEFHLGSWDLIFEIDSRRYHWTIRSQTREHAQLVTSDHLFQVTPDGEIPLVDRDTDHFVFRGKDLPKLPRNQTSIRLLADEETIKPIHSGFCSIRRRHFDRDALQGAAAFSTIPYNLAAQIKQKTDLDIFRDMDLTLSTTLSLLSEYFQPTYATICEHYKAIFPFITEISIRDAAQIHPNIGLPGKAPLFCIKEKSVDRWLPLEGLSSGMQKVLLILTDLYVLPNGSIYLIDEYENSLGINAIEFLPTVFLTLEKDLQLFLTSHHPYIINRVPVANWYVFHRSGSTVRIKRGEELQQKYGRSKQSAFIQLVNDPFYLEGAE